MLTVKSVNNLIGSVGLEVKQMPGGGICMVGSESYPRSKFTDEAIKELGLPSAWACRLNDKTMDEWLEIASDIRYKTTGLRIEKYNAFVKECAYNAVRVFDDARNFLVNQRTDYLGGYAMSGTLITAVMEVLNDRKKIYANLFGEAWERREEDVPEGII